MKVIKREIESTADYLTVLPIGDLHIGDKGFDRKVLNGMIQRLQDEPDTYFCLLGDLCNNATKTSVSDVYNETLTPLDQIQECCRIFEPVKDKCLFGVGGNHEARTFRNDGIDITFMMFAQLGLLDFYSDTTAMCFLKTGAKKGKHAGQKVSYSIYATHGSGGGRKAGGKINRLVDYGTITDADVYICGHTHSPAVVRQNFFRTDCRHGAITEVDKLYLNSAACLLYTGYGDIQGYTPASRKYPEIRFSNSEKKAEALL